MKISTIEVRYMRRVQVQQFEPAEAEVKLQAIVTEGETGPESTDAQAAAVALLVQARGATHQVLLGTAQQAQQAQQARTSTPPAQQAAPAPTATPAAALKATEPKVDKKADKKADKDKPAADAGGIPGEPASAAKVEANSDIPAEPANKLPAAPKPTAAQMTPQELHAYIAGKIQGGKLTAPEMRGLMTDKSKGFDVARLGDLTPDQIVKFKAEVDDIVATREK